MADDSGKPTGRPRLLLVEDESRIADFLIPEFSRLGMDVTLAEDGEVAIFLASTDVFDAVVLDLGLPRVSGGEVLAFLRAECPATPVVVLTARDEPEAREAATASGAAAYVTKPFAFEELCGRVQACVQGVARPSPKDVVTPLPPPLPPRVTTQIWVLTDRRYLEQRMPAALIAWLHQHGHAARVVVADDGSRVSSVADGDGAVSAWADLEPGDVVVTRSRHPFALALLQEAESRGARTVGTWEAVQQVRNKARAMLALEEHGLPAPQTFLAGRPEDLAPLDRSSFPLLLKPFQGDNSRGIRLVRTPEELASVEWREPIVMAQRYVDAGGVDVKVYAVGGRTWAVRCPSPLTSSDGGRARVPVDATLGRLADACREIFALPLLGIDLVESSDGPLIVDVNEFPNYTGIDEAPGEIGRLLLARATAARETAAAALP
jgi:glutathione synthase/RimK-type ligase-like ATP-grasp enzyme/DNA-binding NarL/FixJ family response regulator